VVAISLDDDALFMPTTTMYWSALFDDVLGKQNSTGGTPLLRHLTSCRV